LFFVAEIALVLLAKKVEERAQQKIQQVELPAIKGNYSLAQFLEQLSLVVVSAYCWFMISKTIAVIYLLIGLIAIILRFQYQAMMKRFREAHRA